jgi:hypothetical protein
VVNPNIPRLLCTVEQAREHLRSDTSVDDALLTTYIAAASALVIEYIDRGIIAYQDTSGAFLSPNVDSAGFFVPPDNVVAAVLIMVGYLYAQRDQDTASEFADGRLPRPVRALLSGIRYPSV